MKNDSAQPDEARDRSGEREGPAAPDRPAYRRPELVETLGPSRPQVVFSTGSPRDIPEDIAAIGVVLAKPYDTDELIEALREPAARGLFSRLRKALRPEA